VKTESVFLSVCTVCVSVQTFDAKNYVESLRESVQKKQGGGLWSSYNTVQNNFVNPT
jgi:hypothetical protein